MRRVEGFTITGRSLGASSGAEGLPFMAKAPAVAGVWAEPPPQDAAYSLSCLVDANLSAMVVNCANATPAHVITAVNAAADIVAMPPPPPLDALRRRGPPPVPKVPLRQADAYLALAKVPSGAGTFIHAGTQLGFPTLLLRRKVNI